MQTGANRRLFVFVYFICENWKIKKCEKNFYENFINFSLSEFVTRFFLILTTFWTSLEIWVAKFSIYDKTLNFYEFLTKFWIFDRIFNFWRNFLIFNKLLNFWILDFFQNLCLKILISFFFTKFELKNFGFFFYKIWIKTFWFIFFQNCYF